MLPLHVGDPRDCALLQFVLEMGLAYQHYRDEYPHQKHIEYKSSASDEESQQYTATVIRVSAIDSYRVYVKGGIGYILDHSKWVVPNHPNEKIILDDIKKEKTIEECKHLQEMDMTLIAFAVKDIPVTGKYRSLADSMHILNFVHKPHYVAWQLLIAKSPCLFFPRCL